MNADLKILEYDKIIERLAKYSETDLGKKMIRQLIPSNNQDEVVKWLEESQEAKQMIERFDSAPMGGVLNLENALQRAKLGASLNIEELQAVVSLENAVQSNLRFIRKIRSLDIKNSALSQYFDPLIALPALKKAIEECIDDRGFVVDSASPELAQIRKKIVINQKKVQEKMEHLLRSEASKLTDSIVTIRNGRLVLPVKAEYKNSFPGVIHDLSASKETVFIEPYQVMELNNLGQNLMVQEQVEVERILYTLSMLVAKDYESIQLNFELLTQLDVIFAKGKYANQIDAICPQITSGEILIHQARHPLIDPSLVVANTIAFREYKAIIITGPNTGGKTVAMKTLGLLSLMAQTGLLIPALEPSKLPIFSGIYADIGDEQSIEQSLSTFSSHITKIIDILQKAQPQSLILLDELGSGTDPKEGASLAISIMDHLRQKDVFVMVSTHYPELKIYAYDLDDVLNASVEFDIHTLKPTYRLLLGIPGTSNAIDIASRLGLPKDITEHAREVSLTFDNQTMNLIKKLERQSLAVQEEMDLVKKERVLVQEKLAELEKQYIEARRSQTIQLAQIEVQREELLAKAKEQAQALIEELDTLKKQESFKEHELARLKHEVKALDEVKIQPKKQNFQHIQVGDVVQVIPYQRQGIIMKDMNQGNYQVQMGALTTILNQDQLEYSKKASIKPNQSKVTTYRQSNPKMELDLRGLRFEEAMQKIDKFMDDCLMDHLEFAYIIHGFGTGALRKGVQEYVKQSSLVKSSRPGGMNEGGNGVTVVYFK